jgi:beta-phosphoglucomutase-like phosphatase (HAD superfamily)
MSLLSYTDTVEIEDSLTGVLESRAAGCLFTVIIFRHRASLMTGAGNGTTFQPGGVPKLSI